MTTHMLTNNIEFEGATSVAKSPPESDLRQHTTFIRRSKRGGAEIKRERKVHLRSSQE